MLKSKMGSAFACAPHFVVGFASLLLLTGCRATSSRNTAGLTVVEVRLNALVPLHPAYADVTAMDKRDLVPLTSSGTKLTDTQVKLNFPDIMPPVKPATLEGAIGTESVAIGDNAGLTTLENSNREHIRRILDRERHTLQQRLVTDLAQERVRLLAIPPPNVPSKDFTDIRNRLRKLVVEQIALESNARVLTVPGIIPITERLTAINLEIDSLRQKLRPSQILAENTQLDENLAKYKQTKESVIEQTLTQRSITLRREGDVLLESVRSRMLGSASAIKRVNPVDVSPPMNMRQVSQMPLKITGPSLKQSTKIDSSTTSRSAMRDQMLAFIKSDLQRRVDRIALKNHWKVTYVEVNKGNDFTDKVVSMLSADFSGRDLAE